MSFMPHTYLTLPWSRLEPPLERHTHAHSLPVDALLTEVISLSVSWTAMANDQILIRPSYQSRLQCGEQQDNASLLLLQVSAGLVCN